MTRLIDADALWQKVFSHTYPVRILDNENKVLNEVLRLIDNAPTVEYPFYQEAYQTGYEEGKKETQKDDDLCESCRYGDTCGRSDKGVSFAKHSKCWYYEKKEADNEDKT